MKRIILIILSVIGTVVVLFILAVFLFIWGMMGGFEPNPPRPKITYGEFPFKLVYELNGERITVEDTLICEYDGIDMDEGQGKHRHWKSYLSSNKEERSVKLLELEDTTKIYYSTGSPAYYLGFAERPANLNDPFNGVFAVGPSRSELHYMDIKDMLEYLNIVLIEWEIAPPIENGIEEE